MSTSEPRICVAICERDAGAVLTAIQRTAPTEDSIEVRLDCINEGDLPSVIEHLRHLPEAQLSKTILTFRPQEQGGLRPLTLDHRRQFWLEHGPRFRTSVIDLEIDLVEDFLRNHKDIDWSRVICSIHDFTGDADLNELYERLAVTPARYLKVAVMVNDASDNVEIFRLIKRAASEGRELIAIGIGNAGTCSRVLGPSRGSSLIYASPDQNSATAPGQLTATELRDCYRVEQITERTEVLGLIGRPIAHSLSPQIHNAALKHSEIDAVYLPFEVDGLTSFIRRMVRPATREIDWSLRGLSVTTPHKQTVMDHLDWMEPAAIAIGAVNTVVIDGEQLNGYNTDATGFITALTTRQPELSGKQCAVIGAGGVARAAVWSLLSKGAKVSVFARDTERAKPLVNSFGVPANELRSASFKRFDVVVNTTLLGMSGELEQQTPASAEQLRGARLAYDLVYNPTETRFLCEAKTAGCETLGGLLMFVAQAAEQFRLWTGENAPVDVMHAAAGEALNRS